MGGKPNAHFQSQRKQAFKSPCYCKIDFPWGGGVGVIRWRRRWYEKREREGVREREREITGEILWSVREATEGTGWKDQGGWGRNWGYEGDCVELSAQGAEEEGFSGQGVILSVCVCVCTEHGWVGGRRKGGELDKMWRGRTKEQGDREMGDRKMCNPTLSSYPRLTLAKKKRHFRIVFAQRLTFVRSFYTDACHNVFVISALVRHL